MNEKFETDRLADICAVMSDSYEIPVAYINRLGEFEYCTAPPEDKPYMDEIGRKIAGLAITECSCSVPVIHSNVLLENYIEVRLEEEREYKGSLIAGPSKFSNVPPEILHGIETDLQHHDKEALRSGYERLKVIPQKKLLQAGALLYYLVYGKRLDIVNIVLANRSIETPFQIDENVDIEVSDRLNNASLHHDWMNERRLMLLVKEGRDEELAQGLAIGILTEGVGTLSRRSHLRHLKNLSIAGIAIATRAAMDGGLHPEIAYTMSDIHIQQIEELNDSREVDKAMKQALVEFAARVRTGKEENVSSAVAACKRYIFNHMYEELTLEKLSGLVHMNPSYLSRHFKKETGTSITDYIQAKRIEEAKKLLTLTSCSISDIYSRLNFSDQSYFTKVFKKIVGVTPKQYRDGKRDEPERNSE